MPKPIVVFLKLGILFSCLAVFLFDAENLRAQDLSGLSICLDPGHGAGNTNQGPTGLREADINLGVALFLKDFLKSAGIDTVLLTRVDDSTNPSLSQREALANSFGVDWFHSVHHNACGVTPCTARSTIVLMEEERSFANPCPDGKARGTGQPEWPGQSDVMSDFMGNWIFKALRTTSTTSWLDWTFYGGCNGGFSLGVLNDLQMPGELSEATFHQNRVEENKLRNPDFLKLEARALFMGILDFYEAGKMPTGALSGIIRDDETKSPLNGVEVVINPGDLHYTTDDNGNGLFVFQDLAPGTYQIAVNLPNFVPQQKSVTVQAHAFSSADFNLVLDVPPTVPQTLPANETEDVSVYNEIGVRFSRPMDRASVEDAFEITPAVAGHFLWSVKSDIILFEPDTRFEFETVYTVTIRNTAVDTNGRAIDGNGDGVEGDSFSYRFTTQMLDNSQPVVLDFYPTQRDTGVFARDIFTVTFNEEIDPESVNSATVLLSGDGGLAPSYKVIYVPDGSRTVNIIPLESLKADTRFFITLTKGIQLTDGTPLASNFVWQFNTQSQAKQFTRADDFESGLHFDAPQNSTVSTGFDSDSTNLTLARQFAISDSQAAALSYLFESPTGLLQIDYAGRLDLDLNKATDFGIYVFGDNSNNSLRLLFADGDGTEMGPWQPVNWSGWRLLKTDVQNPDLSADGANGAFDAQVISFAGLQLQAGGSTKGRLLFDDLFFTQPDLTVSVGEGESRRQTPATFLLQQNYPNPFNPETTIRYRLTQAGPVELAIFNLQGQLIRTLFRGYQQAGEHRLSWNGRDNFDRLVSSGIYLYRFKGNGKEITKRMIFLK